MAAPGPPPSPNTPLTPPPPGEVSDFSHPQNDQRYMATVATLGVLFGFSTLCVLLRTWTRAVIVNRFGWDDGFALLSMFLNIGFTICIVGEIRTGLNDYDWNVRLVDFLKYDAPTYNYWNAVSSIMYYLLYCFIKISILALYLRVLGGTKNVIRWCIWFLIFAVVGITVGCTADLLSFCNPPGKLFNPAMAGNCDGFNKDLFFAQALLSALTDIFILIPPIPIIWKLSASPKRKLGLTLILCLGFFVTGIATARAVLLSPNFNSALHPLYDNWNGVYWGILEVNLAIAVVCLPALAQLFFKFRAPYRQNNEQSPQGGRGAAEVVLEDGSPVHGSGESPRNGKNKRGPSSISRIVNGMIPGSMLSEKQSRKQQSHVQTFQTAESLSSVAEKSSDDDEAISALPPSGSHQHGPPTK